MSLANVLAVSHAARNLVLLGDPRQLDQPTQGSHPEGTSVSALDYVLNAQVFELKDRIPGGRIGTVDKFQGQEAPIVIYSMTTSTHADAPRGMNFLYSLNRLNVATSRARCLSILVCSPALFEPECRTPEQIQMANAFCRYLEMATTLTFSNVSG